MKKKLIVSILMVLITAGLLVSVIAYSKVKDKELSYQIGILSGILFVEIFFSIVSILNKKIYYYDERQLLARGICYKYAWGTLATGMFIDGFLREVFEINWADYLAGTLIIAMVSCGVFISLAIIFDAYETVNYQTKSNYIILFIIGIINVLIGVLSGIRGEIIESGSLTIDSLNLVIGIIFVIVTTVGLIKKLVDKKKEKEADDYEKLEA